MEEDLKCVYDSPLILIKNKRLLSIQLIPRIQLYTLLCNQIEYSFTILFCSPTECAVIYKYFVSTPRKRALRSKYRLNDGSYFAWAGVKRVSSRNHWPHRAPTMHSIDQWRGSVRPARLGAKKKTREDVGCTLETGRQWRGLAPNLTQPWCVCVSSPIISCAWIQQAKSGSALILDQAVMVMVVETHRCLILYQENESMHAARTTCIHGGNYPSYSN